MQPAITVVDVSVDKEIIDTPIIKQVDQPSPIKEQIDNNPFEIKQDSLPQQDEESNLKSILSPTSNNKEEDNETTQNMTMGLYLQGSHPATQDGRCLPIGRPSDSHFATLTEHKYGNYNIDLSEINKNAIPEEIQNQDRNINLVQQQMIHLSQHPDEPLPSSSDRLDLKQFSVGSYKEYAVKQELQALIDKYNVRFNQPSYKKEKGAAAIPSKRAQRVNQKQTKYENELIENPIAIGDPNEKADDYAWMCLKQPELKKIMEELEEAQLQNDILSKEAECLNEIKNERDLLNQEYDLLQQSERHLHNKIAKIQDENKMLEVQVENQERNYNQIQPQRFKELTEKLDGLNKLIKAKDGLIEQLLGEITSNKNKKDDMQSELLFKKQKIEQMNFEYQTRDKEYQRLFKENQQLKYSCRDDSDEVADLERENQMLLREIAQIRDELGDNQKIFVDIQNDIGEKRGKLQDYESRLRYANDVIGQLEQEDKMVQIDIAQMKAGNDAQSRAYNDLKNNMRILQAGGDISGISQSFVAVPKIVMSSTYYNPSSTINKQSINLMPSTSKALSQQVAPVNLRSYMSIKKTAIDLTSDFASQGPLSQRGNKVRFSMINQYQDEGIKNNSDDRTQLRSSRKPTNDMMDGPFSPQTSNRRSQQPQNTQPTNGRRVNSVNRNFVDSMAGLLGMSPDKQETLNQRAVADSFTFPLRKDSPQKGYSELDTDYTSYDRPSMTQRGAPYRNSHRQPQQQNSVKQRQSAMQQPDFRQATWAERMSQLPKNSAYKSSITFVDDGVTIQDRQQRPSNMSYEQPFQRGRDMDFDHIDNLNDKDPQTRNRIIKIKQEKIYQMQDQRKKLQEQFNSVPENSRQPQQRQKREDLEHQIEKITKQISTMKYDLKKMTTGGTEE